MKYTIEPKDNWPLPGRIDPNLTPCALCRRRLLVDGQPVFMTCSCKALGPPVTIGALLLGVAALAALGVWALHRNKQDSAKDASKGVGNHLAPAS